MTRSDYQLLGAVALAVFVAFLVNACFAVSVTRRVDSASIGDEVLVSINAYRATLGKPALRFDSRLAGADCLLTLQVDYDRSDWSVTDYLFNTYCWRSDVTCRWQRK